jgi:uncharacterized protein (DUF1810 family)
MYNTANLDRFIEAQGGSYEVALLEIQNGRKLSHWMWYIFPQIKGLGHSEMSRKYAIQSVDEAQAYLKHPLLGARLIEISIALLKIENSSIDEIMGSPDDLKLKSSMTLFSLIESSNPVFGAVLEKYFGGIRDEQTLEIIEDVI